MVTKVSLACLPPTPSRRFLAPSWVGTTKTSTLVFGFRAEDPAGGALPERPSESRVQLSTHTYQTHSWTAVPCSHLGQSSGFGPALTTCPLCLVPASSPPPRSLNWLSLLPGMPPRESLWPVSPAQWCLLLPSAYPPTRCGGLPAGLPPSTPSGPWHGGTDR